MSALHPSGEAPSAPRRTNSSALIDMQIRCKDRPAFRDTILVQDGWTDDGARHMKRIPSTNTKSCLFDLRASQIGCQGCKWQFAGDLRDEAAAADAGNEIAQ